MILIRTRRDKGRSRLLAMCGKTVLAVLFSLLYMPACAAQTTTTPPRSQVEAEIEWYMPEEGVLPDSATAVRAAQVILERVYGTDVIARQLPLVARLDNGIWEVRGTLPRNHAGGTAIIRMDRKDGRVLGMIHER